MAKKFGGTINVDTRDAESDWAPFQPPVASDGASNVLYIVLDDRLLRRLIETPNIDQIVSAGVRYSQFHTTGLCSPTRSCFLTGATTCATAWRASPRRRSDFRTPMARCRRRTGCSRRSWVTPSDTYMVGKWHLCPTAR
jgi:hypothetical protein